MAMLTDSFITAMFPFLRLFTSCSMTCLNLHRACYGHYLFPIFPPFLLLSMHLYPYLSFDLVVFLHAVIILSHRHFTILSLSIT